ncbi:Aste57867_3900 [Aphanomyces stellatus]|uniref:Aste57867_3900 protein n=1 Tax=Aphanomyces stellatus TaxID=120398 RepID=A0A485KG71_9STRA|nr:hypothetical protein As57867_003889 [Aphanomyces stellatus]VFT81041.1 Aste57867_3900 [Aphanomyces stellatus]
MTDLGKLKSILGIQVEIKDKVVTVSQQGYVEQLLEKFNMVDSNPVSTPEVVGQVLKPNKLSPSELKTLNLPYREHVGSLQYFLVTCTRPDIANAVHNLSTYLSCFDESHWKQTKRVLRYLKGTKLLYLKIDCTDQVGAFQVEAYCDADFANSCEDRNPSAAFWSCSSAAVCLQDQGIKELLCALRQPSAIAIAKNPGHHERTKHISTKYHFVRDQVEKGRIQLCYCPTKLMIADILMKAIPREQFEILRSKMGLADGPTN